MPLDLDKRSLEFFETLLPRAPELQLESQYVSRLIRAYKHGHNRDDWLLKEHIDVFLAYGKPVHFRRRMRADLELPGITDEVKTQFYRLENRAGPES
jgi:hypothetical protein